MAPASRARRRARACSITGALACGRRVHLDVRPTPDSPIRSTSVCVALSSASKACGRRPDRPARRRRLCARRGRGGRVVGIAGEDVPADAVLVGRPSAAARLSMPDLLLSAVSPFSRSQKKPLRHHQLGQRRRDPCFWATSPSCLRMASKPASFNGVGGVIGDRLVRPRGAAGGGCAARRILRRRRQQAGDQHGGDEAELAHGVAPVCQI